MTIVLTLLIIVLSFLFAMTLRSQWEWVAKYEEVKKERDALREGQKELRRRRDEDFFSISRNFSLLEHNHSTLQRDYQQLGKDRDELASKLRERQSLVAVKFTANVPHQGWTRTEFKLGLGPCGKNVESIQFVEKEDRFELTQRCTDGERKEFTYMKSDISGRIEKAYRK